MGFSGISGGDPALKASSSRVGTRLRSGVMKTDDASYSFISVGVANPYENDPGGHISLQGKFTPNGATAESDIEPFCLGARVAGRNGARNIGGSLQWFMSKESTNNGSIFKNFGPSPIYAPTLTPATTTIGSIFIRQNGRIVIPDGETVYGIGLSDDCFTLNDSEGDGAPGTVWVKAYREEDSGETYTRMEIWDKSGGTLYGQTRVYPGAGTPPPGTPDGSATSVGGEDRFQYRADSLSSVTPNCFGSIMTTFAGNPGSGQSPVAFEGEVTVNDSASDKNVPCWGETQVVIALNTTGFPYNWVAV